MLQLGVDSSAVASGLATFEGKVNSTLKSIGNSFKNAFSNLMAPLSVAGVIAGFSKVLNMVEHISEVAKVRGVSTDLVQDLDNIGKAAGIASEKIDVMFTRWMKNLPVGVNVEQAFYATADAISAIHDPVARAQAAIEAFGKSGVDMLRIISEGSAGIKRMGAEFAKFSEQDIFNINKADAAIDQAKQNGTIATGWIISQIAETMQAVGTLSTMKLGSGNLFDAWKANRNSASTERASAAAQESKAQALYLQAQRITDAKEKELKIEEMVKKLKAEADKKSEEAAKKSIEAAEKRARLEDDVLEARIRVSNLEQHAAVSAFNSKWGNYLPNMREMADTGVYRRPANEIIWLEGAIKNALLWGNRAGAEKGIERINTLKDALRGAGMMTQEDKTASMEESLRSARKSLAALESQITPEGLKILPTMGN